MSTQNKHTPGEWRALPFGEDSATGLPGESIYGPDNVRVAEILFIRKRSKVEHEANARLIAAAPDLLAACETLRSAMVHMEEFDSLPDDTCPADLIDYLSAALSKARGEA